MRHLALRVSAGFAVLTAALAASPLVAVASEAAVGQLSAVSSLPNWFWSHPGVGKAPRSSMDFVLVADPDNGLLLQMDVAASCDARNSSVVLDMRSHKILTTGCAQGATATQDPRIVDSVSTENAANHIAVRAAVDARRAMVFIPTGGALNTKPPQIVGFDERTLKVKTVWTLPLGAGYHVNGMSVDPVHDQLLVAVDDGDHQPVGPGPGPPVGVTIYTYDIGASIPAPNAQPTYTYKVASCQRGDLPRITPNPPFRSARLPILLVPCTIASSLTQVGTGQIGQPPPKTGVVTVELDATGVPSGKETVALSPGPATSLLYDSTSDRAFLALDGPTGPVVFGYDARRRSFIGRTAIGDTNDTLLSSAGLDARTGRLYGVGASGLYLVDGRRTPLSVGSKFTALGGVGQTRAIVVFPPMPGRPYTQVVVPASDRRCDPFQGTQADQDKYCALPTLRVYADRLPVTVDPPLTSLDSNTYSGHVGAGDLLTSSYSANARGYGLHSDYVGNANATVDNSTFTGAAETLKLPFASGNNDQLSAEVSRLSIANGTTQGAASALADGSGATTTDFHQQAGDRPYPFETAECSHPGPAGGEREVVDGYAAGGDPNHPDTAGTAAQAHAAVDCAPSGTTGATAEARYAGAHPADSPGIGFGASRTTASVTRLGGLSKAEVLASVSGVRIDLGAGNSLSFGRVTHHATAQAGGRAGTAKAQHTVEIADVALTAGGTTTVLCAGVCAGDPMVLFSRINALYPALLHISEPHPDAQLYQGTPKGYIAAVQAEAAQVYGDQGFNGMSAEESTYLPAVRIVIYNDGGANNREVLDLAGVQVDAEFGIDVLPGYTPPPTPPVCCDEPPVPGVSTGAGTSQGTASGPVVAGPAVIDHPRSVLGTLIRKALSGFGWIARSPGDAVRVFTVLALLALPLLLMDRRRRWVRDVMEASP